MVGIQDIFAEIFASPQSTAAFFTQFFVGGLLGYAIIKAGKYIIMVIIALILGGVLGMWSARGISNMIMTELDITPNKLLSLFHMLTLSYTSIVLIPVVIGAVVGALIGSRS